MAENANEAAAGDMLAAARAFAADRGWPVFPVNGKEPLTEHGFKDATTDLDQIRTWWERYPTAGVAVATGEPSGLFVVDVDAQKGGARVWKELCDKHGKPPATLATLTGGGGSHLIFRFPGDVPSSVGRLGDHVDVRAAGGYAVLPPTVHANGRPYKWMNDCAIAEAPPWLVELARGRGNGAAPKPVDEVIPEGRRRDAMLTVAGKLKRSGLSGDEIMPTLRKLNERCRPPLDEAELRSVAYPSTISVDPETAIRTVPNVEPQALDDVLETFRRWLYLPDPGALYVTLGTVAANRMPGDPVWLLLVAASSSGKTEVLLSLNDLDEVVPAATLTEAALLSGVPRRDQTSGATGGLLRKIGDYGILTLKDFGSVLSMHAAVRAGTLAALRECFDGSWDRPMGTDGGKVLSWQGKLGLVAGVTTVVDRHHAVMDSLGSRFAFYRVEVDERAAQTRRALAHRRGAREMRTDLRDAVSALFAGIALPDHDSLTDDDRERLIVLADFVTMARSPIERDSYSREIELVPDPEAPARFALMLASLLEGLYAIGLDRAAAWQLVSKVAFDSMPAQRRQVIAFLADVETVTTTKDAAIALGLPTTTARRVLEDLAAHKLVKREEGVTGNADVWQLTPWTRDKYRESTVPEKSVTECLNYPVSTNDDIPGTVAEA